MTSLRLRAAAFIAAILVIPVIAAEPQKSARPAKIPVEVLFKQPAVAQVSFSPDGRYVACLQPYKHRMNIVVVDTEKLQPVLVTGFEGQDVAAYAWVNDERLVFQMDDDGDEGYGLFAVNRDGKGATVLVPTVTDQIKAGSTNPRSFGILGRVRGDPQHIIAVRQESGSELRSTPSEVVSLDLRNGKQRVIAKNPGAVEDWIVDHQGVVRLGVENEKGRIRVLYRANADAEWEVLTTFAEGTEGWRPLGFDGDNRTLFVASTVGRKTAAVCRYDTAEKRMGEVVVADDVYDADYADGFESSLIYSDSQQRVLGIAYQADKPRIHWIDPQFAAFQRAVDAAMPHTFNRLVALGGEGGSLLVHAFSDRERGVYYLLDLQHKKLREFAVVAPDIDPAAMAAMQPVTFAARDGLTLHGYLTVPKGMEGQKVPLIIHPHGGPFGPRDQWGFTTEVQLYANRGWAVLQINYRGSGGYGREFERAGFRQWGLKMQDDLTDGVKWAVAQGIADPHRVAIVGASYGGYATMAGLVFTPELYCTGVNYVGVTDLVLLGKPRREHEEARRWFEIHIGDADRNSQALHDTSPVNFAERVQVPVLMGYGYNDPRVEVEHGSKMEAALKKHGKKVQTIYERREGHGFHKEENRIAWYQAVDTFLQANLATANFVVREGEPKVIEMPAREGAEK